MTTILVGLSRRGNQARFQKSIVFVTVVAMDERASNIFSILMAAFIVVLVLTNIIGVKLFLAFSEILPGGIFDEAITLITGLITIPSPS